MNIHTLVLRSALVCLSFIICSCATPVNENNHNWNVEISPAKEKPETLALLVQYEHSEHRGNSKGKHSAWVLASPGEGRKTGNFGHGINYARYNLEAGLKVYWINNYYLKAEYDARYRVTGINDRLYQDQSVKGSTTFMVEKGRLKRVDSSGRMHTAQ